MFNTPNQRAIALFQLTCQLFDVAHNPQNYVILDTETTGLGIYEIIEIAVIDIYGNTLLNTRVKPSALPIDPGATKCHGLTEKDLTEAPTFDQIFEQLIAVTKEKIILVYNDDYDMAGIVKSALFANCRNYIQFKSQCVMHWFATYHGEVWTTDSDVVDYKWQKLIGGNHSALGDCLATLSILKKMIDTLQPLKLLEMPYFSFAQLPEQEKPNLTVVNPDHKDDDVCF